MQATRAITLKVVVREVCILQAFEFTETRLMYILIPKTAMKLFTKKKNFSYKYVFSRDKSTRLYRNYT